MQRPMRSMLRRVAGRCSLHMPAAQGRAPFTSFDPYRLDTTELPVTDDLYRPTGAIAEAERLMAASAGAAASLMLCGGSTAGVHAMLLYACKRGEAVVLPRNAHLSCLNLCAVAGLTPVFAQPEQTPEGRVYTRPEAYARALDSHPEATAALAIRTDYYGLVGDLEGIARETHARGRLLLCDEAHGAYFNWRADFPNAGACGADLYVQSAHKTLPALTPGAWLHASAGIDAARLRAVLRMVQTSSPSFLVMLSLDEARAWMDAHGRAACVKLLLALERFRAEAARLGFMDGQAVPPEGARYDRLRLVLRSPKGGAWLQNWLEARGLDVEMFDAEHVVCILSLLDGEKRLRRLLRALRAIAREAGEPAAPAESDTARNGMAILRATETRLTEAPGTACEPPLFPSQWPPRRLPIGEAAFAPCAYRPVEQAIGRISGVSVGRYPPGVAWLTPGDEVTAAIAALIAATPREQLFGLEADGRMRCVLQPKESSRGRPAPGNSAHPEPTHKGVCDVYSFPYDAVLFDLDGTLTCSEQGIVQSMLHALQAVGAQVPAGVDLREIIGPPLMDSLTGILRLPVPLAREAIAHYSDFFNREGMYLYTVYPHIRSILSMLRAGGVYVAMATSKPVRPAMAILNHFGLTHYFNRIITEEDNEKLVNKPELIRRALPDHYEHAAMVGDRFYDIEGALQNGIDAIGAGYGFGTEEELLTAGATHVVPDTESLRAFLCPGAPVPRGFFLTVEGLDGSGKTTQVDRLEKSLRDYGYSVLRTREPGGCEISEEIRHTILTTDHMEMCPACEALLYAASRAQHVHQVIRPAVERGLLVLCDRFVDSSIAYQGGGRELGADTVCQINDPAVAGMWPDATVYLEIDHQRALQRRHSASSLDRIEVESAAFHSRVQAAYEKLIHDDPKRFLIVDGEQDMDTVAADVLDAVLGRLEPELEA